VREAVEILRPEWVIGIGDFASKRAGEILAGRDVEVGRILHPSPASPLANRDWAGTATAQLVALGVWREADVR
jgi:single-strand selective monofunctional uracil DNA glycosylase